MRWVAADANRCEYARATVEVDPRRAGESDAERIDRSRRSPRAGTMIARGPPVGHPGPGRARRETENRGMQTE